MNFDKSNYRIIFVILVIVIVYNSKLICQNNNSLYFMDRIPQSNQLNPASQPKCGFYLGFPGFSSLEINAGNSSMGFMDLYQPNKVLDSLGFKKEFLANLTKDILISGDIRQDWLSFGFRINETYITFAISERAEFSGSIPKDFPSRFLLNGTQQSFLDPTTFSFNFNTRINTTWWREYALGYSTQINNNLIFGLRAKLLFGKANITNISDVTLQNANMVIWQTNTNIELNSSIPNFNVTYKNDGKIDSTNFNKTNDLKSWQNYKDLFNTYNPTNNKGLALDLGFVLKPIDFLSFSASVLDLGYIHWKNNIHSLTYRGPISFRGVPALLSDTVDRLQATIDTFKNIKSKHNQTDYITTLSPKLYIGAHVQLLKSVGVGFLTRFQLIQKTINPQYTFSLNLTPGTFLGTTVSYTIADGVTDNLGFAMNLNFGAMQWYIASERIPLYWAKNVDKGTSIPYIPEYSRNFNFHTGINLVFGYVKNKKLLKDKPLVAL